MARTGRPKTDLKYEHLTIRCPEGLLDQWREAAKRHDRSLNAEIVRVLRLVIDQQNGADDLRLRTPLRPSRATRASV